MKATKARKLFNLLEQLAKGEIIWMPTKQEIDAAVVELMAIEYRAKEFDKREAGANVINETVNGMSYLMCSNCDAMAGNTYCDNCGYKLIYPESDKTKMEDE